MIHWVAARSFRGGERVPLRDLVARVETAVAGKFKGAWVTVGYQPRSRCVAVVVPRSKVAECQAFVNRRFIGVVATHIPP